jgi:hypothetical protein
MKMYRFGYGRTLSWWAFLKSKREENPTIIFTKCKTLPDGVKLGELCYPASRSLSLWEKLTSVWFVFKDVDSLRFWIRSMLDICDKLYPEGKKDGSTVWVCDKCKSDYDTTQSMCISCGQSHDNAPG